MDTMELFSCLWSQEAQDTAEELLQAGRITTGGKHHSPQHRARVLEYERAMRALMHAVTETQNFAPLILDVGGAGSPWTWLVAAHTRLPVQIIDPEFNGLGVGAPTTELENPDIYTVRQFGHNPLEGKADFIACISVLEHIQDEQAFLVDLVKLLAPGGVLFLTVDYDPTNAEKDEFQFHWMRKRIYNARSFYLNSNPDSVKMRLMDLGLDPFGETDLGPLPLESTTIPGLGYTFASLCMRKA